MDILSYVMGVQAGKASGDNGTGGESGGSNVIIKKMRVSVNDSTKTMTVTHDLGVVPDLVLATAFTTAGSKNPTSSSATVQCLGTSVTVGELLGTTETNYLNKAWYVSSATNTIVLQTNCAEPITAKVSSDDIYIYVYNATETSVTFGSGTRNTYLSKGTWDVWVFSGLV